jgi:hypothetical protein
VASICIRSNRESCGWTHSDLKMLAAETIKGLLSFASSYSEACADSRRKAGFFPAGSSFFRSALDRALEVHNLCVSRVRWTQNSHISRFCRPFDVALGQVFSPPVRLPFRPRVCRPAGRVHVFREKPESLSRGSRHSRTAAEPLPQLIDVAQEVSDETP